MKKSAASRLACTKIGNRRVGHRVELPRAARLEPLALLFVAAGEGCERQPEALVRRQLLVEAVEDVGTGSSRLPPLDFKVGLLAAVLERDFKAVLAAAERSNNPSRRAAAERMTSIGSGHAANFDIEVWRCLACESHQSTIVRVDGKNFWVGAMGRAIRREELRIIADPYGGSPSPIAASRVRGRGQVQER